MLSDELEAYRSSVRARAEERIAPLAVALDREQRFSAEVWAELRDMGVARLPFPASVGGDDGSFLAFVVATEELARVSAGAALYPGTTVQVAAAVLGHGTPDQVARWVPRLVAGEAPAAWAFTEPQTGSDPRQLATIATPKGDGWVLAGQKLFISFAAHAEVALVFARTAQGVGAFLVDTSDPGWTVGEPVELLSFGGGEPAAVFLEDVTVPAEQLVGDPGGGFDVLLAGEAQGKIRAAAICVGIAQRATEEAAAYALDRAHRGTPIATKFAQIRALLGEMGSAVLAARALVRHAAELVDAGAPVAETAAAARIIAGRAAREVTSSALQVGGAYGLTRELPLERLYREGKFFEVAQGVVEIQKEIVAKHVLANGPRRAPA